MANEITMTAALTARKGLVSVGSGTLVKSLNMSGEDVVQNTQDITSTSDVQLSFGAITGAPACVLVLNTDATNSVSISRGTGANFDTYKFATLSPGTFLLLPPSSSAYYAKASASTVKVLVVAVEA